MRSVLVISERALRNYDTPARWEEPFWWPRAAAQCSGVRSPSSSRSLMRWASGRFNERDEDRVAAIATHYDLPLVSMRAALLGAVKEDREAAHARSDSGSARAFSRLAQCRARGQLTRSRMRCPQSSELVELSDAQHEATAVHTLGASLGCTTACTTFLLYVCHSAFV